MIFEMNEQGVSLGMVLARTWQPLMIVSGSLGATVLEKLVRCKLGMHNGRNGHWG